MIYKFKPGARLPQSKAQEVGEHLEALRQRVPLTAETVLDDARDEKAPTHEFFEWDDSVAAHQHRLLQARNVLNAVVVEIETPTLKEPMTTRAFVVVTHEEEEKPVYEKVEVVLQDDYLRKQFLLGALRELQGWKKKYEEIEEFSRLFQVMRETEKELVLV